MTPTLGTDRSQPPPLALDHLVVLAADLDSGQRWLEEHLGVPLARGGKHPLMGTHNRLLSLASPEFPCAYLELIAIDPLGSAPLSHRRWFDMDDAPLQARVSTQGPQLVHWVARVGDAPTLERIAFSWRQAGTDPGAVLQASRQTDQGLLSWRITVRPDGRRQLDGTLPTLIHWQGAHPTTALPVSPIWLRSLTLRQPQTETIQSLVGQADGLPSGVSIHVGPPGLEAVLVTPRGPMTLSSSLEGSSP